MKRWKFMADEEPAFSFEQNAEGAWVSWDDVECLQTEMKRLRAELADTRDAIRVIHGHNHDLVWTGISESDVDSFVDFVRKYRAAEAAGGKG